MPNDVFAFPVREWVRGEVPAGTRREDVLVPEARNEAVIGRAHKTLTRF